MLRRLPRARWRRRHRPQPDRRLLDSWRQPRRPFTRPSPRACSPRGCPPGARCLKPDEVDRGRRLRAYAAGTTAGDPKAPRADRRPAASGVRRARAERPEPHEHDAASQPHAPGRVLSTLNEDGSRRWLRPSRRPGGPSGGPAGGGLRRSWSSSSCIPYLRLSGKPLVLLDVPRRSSRSSGTPSCRPTRCCFAAAGERRHRHLPAHRALRAGLVRLGLPADGVHGIPLPADRAVLRGGPERIAVASTRQSGTPAATAAQVRRLSRSWRCSSRTPSWRTSSGSSSWRTGCSGRRSSTRPRSWSWRGPRP